MGEAILEYDEYMSYVTKAGDTFDSIAFDVYTEEKLAWIIMQANPLLCDVLIFDAGVEVMIPVIEEDDGDAGVSPPWEA